MPAWLVQPVDSAGDLAGTRNSDKQCPEQYLCPAAGTGTSYQPPADHRPDVLRKHLLGAGSLREQTWYGTASCHNHIHSLPEKL